ncbi:S-adenosyl-L-methionine-dependent methyltransferase [Umbelopsis sp. AD052]|nr:S-adenosyl-L-methionine-dependent methyltransferase [Umbelopsis sp. AD052]
MGNSHGKPSSKKSGSKRSTSRSTKSIGSVSQSNTLLSTQSLSHTEQDTKAKRENSKPRRLSTLFDNPSTADGDQRRKTKRILSPLLPKKSKEIHEEGDSVVSTIDSPSIQETPINHENKSFFTSSEIQDDVILRAIQAAAEATGSVGDDDPWLAPSVLPVNRPRHSQLVVNYGSSSASDDSVAKQMYYMSENAGERRKEVDRHTRQHYLLKQIFGSIHKSPLDSPKKIIDLGCGTGVWCVEMALKYPTAHILGWALDPPTVSVPDSLKNLSFAKVDLFQPDAGIHLLDSDTVDFIYIRDLALIMATNERWLSAIKEAYRVLRPGGWIEIIEPDYQAIKCGSNFKKLVDVLEIALVKANIDPEYAKRFKTHLEDSEFVACEEDIYKVPIGEWPLDANERENGYLFRDLAIRRFQAMKRWFVYLGGLSEETFDNLWQMALEENEEGTVVLWRINRGMKPLQP